MKRLGIFFILSIFFNAVYVPAISAQIFLEQGKVQKNIRGGENIIDHIKVHNTSDEPIRLSVYWEDFLYVAPYDGAKQFFPQGTTSSSIGTWINFSPTEFVLEPFAKKEIDFTVNVPPDVQGGYYGVLFVEREAQEAKSEKGLNIITRVGCLFFLETANKIKKASLSEITLSKGSFKGAFKNEGDAILIPESVYYIMSEDGLVVDRGRIDNVYVPPQVQADYMFNFSPEIDPGQYSLVITMDLQEGDVLVKEIDFQKTSTQQMNIIQIRD
jgi:hypothetical protein